VRDKKGHQVDSTKKGDKQIELVELFPWKNMFYPNDYKTFADLALSQEAEITDKTDFYFQFLGNRSPGGWITSCAHPGNKAHELFANCLFKKINNDH
jgi:hypothetical protein